MIIERSETVDINDRLRLLIKTAGGRFPTYSVLALDPGETTGVAFWEPETPEKIVLQQWKTKNLKDSFEHLGNELLTHKVGHLRSEAYRIYAHKLQDHTFSPVYTIQWIGCIKLAASLHEVPYSEIVAQNAKSFWTDEKLKMMGVYTPGMRHARDALRHILYYLTFPNVTGM